MNDVTKIIVVEGPDGVGKTTLAANLVNRMLAEGISVVGMSLPGRELGTFGNMVYKLHHNPEHFNVKQLHPTALQLMHAAAHIDEIYNRINPLIDEGYWIVLDRWWWSTIAYGRAYGVDRESLDLIRMLAYHHWRMIWPSKVILLARDTSTSGGSKEAELANEYLELSRYESDRVDTVVLNNNDPVETSNVRMWEIVEPLLYSKGTGRQKPRTNSKRRCAESSSSWEHTEPLHPTAVYDSYWRFAAERQAILHRRLAGVAGPWTTDPVLKKYRFTNAYRASDRVSQYLIREVIYGKDWSPNDLVLRILLFKVFNKIETWQLIEEHLGCVTWDSFDANRLADVLESSRINKQPVYSGAYIMASAGTYGHTRKHENHLAMIEHMMNDDLPRRLQDTCSLQEVYGLLRAYPSIGPFLAYQYAIDLNYSEIIDYDESDFVVPGPGARDGIAKCFENSGGLTETDIIHWMTDRQVYEFNRLGLDFNRLGNRPLKLIDCQNLFCEVGKYARVQHPEIHGRSERKRIKQVFSPRSNSVTLWFPPKWNINTHYGNSRAMRERSDARLFR